MTTPSNRDCSRIPLAASLPLGDETPKPGRQEKGDHNAKLVKVVPDGDLLLKVGKGDAALDIRVSATVVSLASEVFGRMLSSNFVEGQTKTIILTEDEPKIVLAFCNIVHHKSENIDDLELQDVEKLGVFADMRMCTTALRPWALMRIARFVDTLNREEWAYWSMQDDTFDIEDVFDLTKLLPIITSFRMDRLFYKYSRMMLSSRCLLRNREYNPKSLPVPTGAHLRVTEILDTIDEAGLEQVLKFIAAIVNCVGDDFGSEGDLSCQWHKYGFLMYQLRSAGIDSSTDAKFMAGQSLQIMACKVKALVDNFRHDDSFAKMVQGEGCCNGEKRKCKYCSRDFAKDLDQVVNRFLKELPGICLECYLSNGKNYLKKHGICHHQKAGKVTPEVIYLL